MSPRFQRRPDKRTGTGGRGRRFGGAGDSRGASGGRDRDRDPDGPAGPEQWGRGPRFRPRRVEQDRPGAARGPRAGWGERLGDDRGRRPAPERGGGRGRVPVRGPERGGERRFERRIERRPPGARFAPPRDRGVGVGGGGGGGGGGVGREPGLPERQQEREFAERHGEDQPSDLIWGRHAAAAALESGRPIHRIWCSAELRFRPPFLLALREAKAAGVLVEEVTWARLGQITGGAVHQGIVLQPAAADSLDLASLIEACGQLDEPPLLMALDGITDPHNLGAIARSAEALGAHGLVLPQRRSAGLTGSVAKVAAGALEHLPVARVVNLNRALDSLKQEGYRVVGLAAEGSVTLPEADLDGPLVIVTGSEGDGLSMLTRRHCDILVRIPLRGATPSLNASVASAMVLYEVARRGWMKELRGGQPAPRLQRPQLGFASAGAVSPAVSPAPPESTAPVAVEAGWAASVEPSPQLPGSDPASGPAEGTMG